VNAVDRRPRLRDARLYLVCGSRPGGRPLPDVLSAAIAGGVDVVQLRDKRLDDAQLTAAARAAKALCSEHGVLLIVNDRPAVALAVGADGVHVGQEDMAVEDVRAIVGRDMLIGLSTHSPAQIEAASAPDRAADGRAGRGPRPAGRGGADYIGVGPVYATPTKPGRPAVGLELVRYAATHTRAPFFAIGGIDAGNVDAVLAAGATRVAVVRAIAEADNPEQAARALRAALDAPRSPVELFRRPGERDDSLEGRVGAA
jgi:thiamine-phosphate pyrophosphorylase